MNPLTPLQAGLMGIVHGLTQFLPISAFAHMVCLPWFLRWEAPSLAFRVFLRLGAMLAVLLYFAHDWWGILKGGVMSIIDRRIGFDRDRLLFWLILLGTLPTIVIVLLVGDDVRRAFDDSVLLAIPLALVGLFLYWIDGKYAALRSLEELNGKDALFVALAQVVSVIPGVGRSAATITMGRLMGLSREASVRYSLFLAFPVLLVTSLSEWRVLSDQVGVTISLPLLLVGLVATTVAGMFCIYVLLRFAREATFAIFAWYRCFLAAVIVGWSLYRG